MSVEDTVKRYKPLKSQLPLFTKGIDHLEVKLDFCIGFILDSRTYFGRAKDLHVVYLKTQQDIEDVREWIQDTYAPETTVIPYLFMNEYFCFWKSSETKSMYCEHLGSIISDLQEDLDDLKRLAKQHETQSN